MKIKVKQIEAPKVITMGFHGDKVQGIRVHIKGTGEVRHYFGLKRICENLGVKYDTQRAKIPQLYETLGPESVVLVKAPAPNGKAYTQTALERKAVYALLTSISPSKVTPKVKEKLILYIRELFTAWDEYLKAGKASKETQEFLGEATKGAKIGAKQLKTAVKLPKAFSPLEADAVTARYLNASSRFIKTLMKAGVEPSLVKQAAKNLMLRILGLKNIEPSVELTNFLRSKNEIDIQKHRSAALSFGHYLSKHLPNECCDGKVAKEINGAVRYVNTYKASCCDKIESLYQEWLKENGKQYLR